MITCSRHSFLENCPWEAVQEDHIQVDLADPDNTVGAIAVMKERLKEQGGRLNALIKQCGDLTQGDEGRRLRIIETDHDWLKVFQLNFLPRSCSPAD